MIEGDNKIVLEGVDERIEKLFDVSIEVVQLVYIFSLY